MKGSQSQQTKLRRPNSKSKLSNSNKIKSESDEGICIPESRDNTVETATDTRPEFDNDHLSQRRKANNQWAKIIKMMDDEQIEEVFYILFIWNLLL